MIMMMGKYVRGRVWCINCPRFHASYQFQVPCQGFLSTSSVLTGYQWQHTISWRPKINDSPKINVSPKNMIHLLRLKDIAIIFGCLSYYADSTTECRMPLQDGAADKYVLVIWGAFLCIYNHYGLYKQWQQQAFAFIFTSWYSGMCNFAIHHLCFLHN